CHRRPRRDAIVDEHHRLAAQVQRTSPGAIQPLTPFQLRSLPRDDSLDIELVETEIGHRVVIEKTHTAARDGAEGELRIERRAEPARDRVAARPSASRQAEHDDVAARILALQRFTEKAAGLSTVAEDPRPMVTPFHGNAP